MTAISKNILSPRNGYDIAAPFFQYWKWTKYWTQVESPIIKKIIAKIPHDFDILDVGCGQGQYAKHFENFKSYIGIDISKNMLRLAKDINPNSNFILHDIMVYQPDFAKKFDLIVAPRVLSHISKLDILFANFKAYLKPNGRILITDIHPEHKYICTKIPSKNHKVCIETHKHSIKSVLYHAQNAKIIPCHLREFSINELNRFYKTSINLINENPCDKILYLLFCKYG